jgi:hypothetical protein
LRPRSKNDSAGSTLISVFRMSRLFRYLSPFFLKLRLNLHEATKTHSGNLAFVMTMVMPVRRIVAHDTAVIAGTDQRIDIGEVISDDSALAINPNFPAHDATSIGLGQVKLFID